MTAQRLSALEAAFVGLESRDVPFVYACILELDRPVAVGALRKHISALLPELPRYRQRIERRPLRRPRWLDDDFDIARHVRTAQVKSPGGLRQLHELAGELLGTDVPIAHAPWRMWTVQGLDGGRGAVIMLVHHALVDGVAGVRLLERVLGAPSTPEAAPPAGERHIKLRWKDARALLKLLGQGLMSASDVGINPRKVGHDRVVASCTTKLADIRSIQAAFEVTTNDVVLAAVAGALRALLLRRGLRAADLDDVRVMVPVGRHGKDGAITGNKVALLLVPLPMQGADAVERLLRVHASTRGLKSGRSAAGGDLLVALAEATRPELLTGVLKLALRRRAFNAIVTNVPGPHERLSLLGAELVRLVPIVNLWPHEALGIAVASYASTLTVGLQADREVISAHELDELRDDIARELHQLVADSHRERAA